MAIGTSLGAYFESPAHHQAGVEDVEDNVLDPETTPDIGTRDQNVKTPVDAPTTASTMPVRASQELTGALKSSEGTKVPPEKITNPGAPGSDLPDIDDVPHHDWVENIFKSVKEAFKLPGEVFGGKVDPTSQQGIEKAAELAGFMIAGPAPIAEKAAAGELGSFMGLRSKTFNNAKRNEAMAAEANGVHPDDIWTQTGTFKGADNRWRQEIPDRGSSLKDSAFDKTISGEDTSISLKQPKIQSLSDILFGNSKIVTKLPDVLDHPELYKAYPELTNVKVEPFPYETNMQGMYSPGSNTVHLGDNLNPESAKSVLLHEVQHKIQDIEGFARGGSSAEFMSPELTKQIKVLDQVADSHLDKLGLSPKAKEDILGRIKDDPETLKVELDKAVQKKDNPYYQKLQKIVDARIAIQEAQRNAFDKYQRIQGEVEARNVQTRRDFSLLASKQNPPRMTEDFGRELQINPKDIGKPNLEYRPRINRTDEEALTAERARSKKNDDLDVQRRNAIKEDLAKNPIEDSISPRSPTKEIDRLIDEYNSGNISMTNAWILKRLLKDRYK